MHCLKGLRSKQNDTTGAIRKKLDYLTCPVQGRAAKLICKTGILLVIETTWESIMRHGLSASLVLASFVRQLNCRTGCPKYGVLKVREDKERIRQPLVRFKPCFGRAVMVPLPLRPWYFESVVMYVKHWFCYFARAGVGAALLRLLRTCQAVLL